MPVSTCTLNRLGCMPVLSDHFVIRRANLARKVPGAVGTDLSKSMFGGPKYGRLGDMYKLQPSYPASFAKRRISPSRSLVWA